MRIGYHASHEQFAPSELLELVQLAEREGFASAMCSDHLAPWTREQGESGFAYAWLGAALATTGLRMGAVTAPGYRYHPAVVAQMVATLAEMFPGRFWVALGSGEALNEHVIGTRWPAHDERDARLLAAVDVIRRLLAGEEVTRREGPLRVERARVYTRPAQPPLLFGAAVSPETARFCGSWADGLITVSQPEEELRKVVDAFRTGGGEGKPMLVQAQVCLGRTREAALEEAHGAWRWSVLPGPVLWKLATPEEVEAASAFVRPEDVLEAVDVGVSGDDFVERFSLFERLGFDEALVHHVGRDQRGFISRFARELLPRFAPAAERRAGRP